MSKKRPYKEYQQVRQSKQIATAAGDKTENNNGTNIEGFVKDFATSLRRDITQAQVLSTLSAASGKYQPILAEQLLQDININPSAASSDDIQRWLLSPAQHDQELRALSQYLENAVGQYNRAVHYFADILAFNVGLFPKDVNSDLYVFENPTQYKQSYLRSCDILARMKPQDRFHAMSLATMQDGVSFWWLEDTNTEISFLQLPTDFCYITSKWAMGWTAAIDLSYFDKMSYVPNIIPELQEAYRVFITKRDVFSCKNLKKKNLRRV